MTDFDSGHCENDELQKNRSQLTSIMLNWWSWFVRDICVDWSSAYWVGEVTNPALVIRRAGRLVKAQDAATSKTPFEGVRWLVQSNPTLSQPSFSFLGEDAEGIGDSIQHPSSISRSYLHALTWDSLLCLLVDSLGDWSLSLPSNPFSGPSDWLNFSRVI